MKFVLEWEGSAYQCASYATLGFWNLQVTKSGNSFFGEIYYGDKVGSKPMASATRSTMDQAKEALEAILASHILEQMQFIEQWAKRDAGEIGNRSPDTPPQSPEASGQGPS